MHSGSTDLRVVKTRLAIQSRFLDLLLKKNFNELTVKDITSAANIGRGTFYLHYQDKYDLLEKVIEEGLETTIDMFQPHEFISGGQVIPERIIQFILEIFKHFRANERFFRAMLFNEGIPVFRHRMQQRFLKKFHNEVELIGLKDKLTDPATLEILPIFISSGMIGLVGWWFENQMRIPEKDMARKIFLVMTQGPLKTFGLRVEEDK
ncbi:MAG: TetR/AcrR family transcriptional regulator [Sporolactobacillus laevolacticus]|jgi:AcrR family transcriptional regulator|nr:TetR/AcrR family transcriptional regulator [Sporolactobacillus laevolacticus]